LFERCSTHYKECDFGFREELSPLSLSLSLLLEGSRKRERNKREEAEELAVIKGRTVRRTPTEKKRGGRRRGEKNKYLIRENKRR